MKKEPKKCSHCLTPTKKDSELCTDCQNLEIGEAKATDIIAPNSGNVMYEELNLVDFKVVSLDTGMYFSYEFEHAGKEYELCLEPCYNGFDIALYVDSVKDLVYNKECTNENTLITIDMANYGQQAIFKGQVVQKAVKIANRIVRKLYKENQN